MLPSFVAKKQNDMAMHMKNSTLLIGIAAASLVTLQANAADTYTIDPAHTRVGFSARHFGINNVKGIFREFTGTLVLDGGVLKEATATIQVQSIATGVTQRDNHFLIQPGDIEQLVFHAKLLALGIEHALLLIKEEFGAIL